MKREEKDLMNSSVNSMPNHTRGKKCKLVIRGFMTNKIILEEEYDSIISAKRALREKYYHICNAEYAIFRDGKEVKFRKF